MQLEINTELKSLIPPLSADEYSRLEKSIVAEGCRDAIVIWNGLIVDGHNRYEICTRHGISFRTVETDFTSKQDAMVWMIDNQLSRRNLPDFCKCELVAKKKEILLAAGEERMKAGGGDKKSDDYRKSGLSNIDKPDIAGNQYTGGKVEGLSTIDKPSIIEKSKEAHNTQKALAKDLDWSTGKVAMAEVVMKKADEGTKEKLRKAEISINQAYVEIKKGERKELQKEKVLVAEKNHDAKTATWKITRNQEIVRCAALITDPPYGILAEKWEPDENGIEAMTREWAARWNGCYADTILVFFSQRYLWQGKKWLDESFSEYEFQQLLVWHYPNNKSPQSRKGFKQTWEPIFFYRKKGSERKVGVGGTSWGEGLNDFDCHVAAVPQSNFNNAECKVHPAQKPVSVFRWLINAVTEPGEMVCDPFAGSGASGIAATQLRRRWHGIETDEEYIAQTRGRIAAYGYTI